MAPLLPLLTLEPGFGLALLLGVVLGGFEDVPFPSMLVSRPDRPGRTMFVAVTATMTLQLRLVSNAYGCLLAKLSRPRRHVQITSQTGQ